ncbi:hypothetical protein ACJBU6_11630 [Exserohilum turcicum]
MVAADGTGEGGRNQATSQRDIQSSSRAGQPLDALSSSLPSPTSQLFPPYYATTAITSGGVSMAMLLQHDNPDTQTHTPIQQTRPIYSSQPVPLTHREAVLVHHFTENLGRWLDCTDATHQFTLGVPEKVKHCLVLGHAVLAFAARHCKQHDVAEAAYQSCISLLIMRLNDENASHDETLLCAIVILHFYEQLSLPSRVGSEDEQQHLAGCSAIIRSSQGYHFVDPSAPTLREAAFWVYVRQCIHNATMNKQLPDIDFSLQLHPEPSSMRDVHPLARLRLETAWSNQMAWNLARVVNYCFDGSEPYSEMSPKMEQWQNLWELVQTWMRDRPAGFNAIYEGPAGDQGPFPNIWFTADWHAVSFCFYHFACIMLLRYKPGSKLATHNMGSLSEPDHQILKHARAICGAAKSSKETATLAIIVRHTVFVWGPLVSDTKEREEVVQILAQVEKDHVWPTMWIINALRVEWGISSNPTASISPMEF